MGVAQAKPRCYRPSQCAVQRDCSLDSLWGRRKITSQCGIASLWTLLKRRNEKFNKDSFQVKFWCWTVEKWCSLIRVKAQSCSLARASFISCSLLSSWTKTPRRKTKTGWNWTKGVQTGISTSVLRWSPQDVHVLFVKDLQLWSAKQLKYWSRISLRITHGTNKSTSKDRRFNESGDFNSTWVIPKMQSPKWEGHMQKQWNAKLMSRYFVWTNECSCSQSGKSPLHFSVAHTKREVSVT